jgi:hypothetical protein
MEHDPNSTQKCSQASVKKIFTFVQIRAIDMVRAGLIGNVKEPWQCERANVHVTAQSVSILWNYSGLYSVIRITDNLIID